MNVSELASRLKEAYNNRKLLLCASGGLDSSVLAFLIKKAGIEFSLFFADSPIRRFESRRMVQRLAEELHVELYVEKTQEYEIPEFRSNPFSRCYICKKVLFEKASSVAQRIGANLVCDGSNLDDLKENRPGLKAAEELSVESPLVKLGCGKTEIKKAKNALKLELSEEPTTCFATRFLDPSKEVDAKLFNYIDETEKFLTSIGFSSARARILKNKVLLQVKSNQVEDLKMIKKLVKYPMGYKLEVDPLGYRKLGEMLKEE